MLENNPIFDAAECSDSDAYDGGIDADACSEIEITNMFRNKFHLADEQSVALKKSYVLHMSASRDFDKIVVSTSTKSVKLFSLSNGGFSQLSTETKVAHSICGVRFANNDPNIFFVATEDGTISMQDLRLQEIVSTFKDTRADKNLTISCFDINQTDWVLCAGTDKMDQDVYALFFDVRKISSLGCYWEGHSNDICSVKFHPENPQLLATGSTDGLINVYDIAELSEDDALQYCVNTESSVANVQWHRNANDKDILSCVTHSSDLHLYDVTESELIVSYNRKSITECLKRTSTSECNVINCHSASTGGHCIVIAGSNHNNGECLRSIVVNSDRSTLPMPYANFSGNRQIVRCSVFNQKDSMLITGGEGGFVTLWLPGEVDDQPQQSELVIRKKDKNKKHKSKPY